MWIPEWRNPCHSVLRFCKSETTLSTLLKTKTKEWMKDFCFPRKFIDGNHSKLIQNRSYGELRKRNRVSSLSDWSKGHSKHHAIIVETAEPWRAERRLSMLMESWTSSDNDQIDRARISTRLNPSCLTFTGWWPVFVDKSPLVRQKRMDNWCKILWWI